MSLWVWLTLGALIVVGVDVIGAFWQGYTIKKEFKRMAAQETVAQRMRELSKENEALKELIKDEKGMYKEIEQLADCIEEGTPQGSNLSTRHAQSG